MFNYAGQGGLGMGPGRRIRHQTGPARPSGGQHPGRRRLSLHLSGVEHGGTQGHPPGEHRAEQQLPRRGKGQQQRYYDQRYIGVDLENPRFDRLAEVYGAKGYYVERPEDVADAVREALTLDGPSVVEIPVAEYFPPSAPCPTGGNG